MTNANDAARPVRLVVAGGGTGGHVLPAIAVLDDLRDRGLLGEALWIGSHSGLERETARAAGISFRAIQTGKLRRYPSLETTTDALRIPVGIVQARRALTVFRPDVVFSTGGFVSVPTAIAAKGIAPLLTHEQTAILGLATRINARFADVLAISWAAALPEARKIHRHAIATGNPVRAALARGNAARGLARWGFSPDLPLLYVTGGARGASPINTRLAALLPDLLEHTQVLHQTGPESANTDRADLLARRATWPEHLQRRYQAIEFLRDELPDAYAAGDLVVGRAGAGIVAELAFLGKPAVLIPLPGAGSDEQTRNARLLADAGGAVLLPQHEATPETLRAVILELLDDPARRQRMADAARGVGQPDAARRLADALLDLANTPRR
ncbi:MAG: undecaprenyldiphospho-muramoylpentapeptide beta-N-acetylglucosaminyltransferase [Thermomicrobiales bacterium]|nr:undecaprenyldiphospho-muramoylpentapeptide beta-N-acetylglucosaminyltransferase [Thermomicrobiales bacterium]